MDRLKAHTGVGPVSPAGAASHCQHPKELAAPKISLRLSEAADSGGPCGG
jgi:hypothetical protein